MTLTTGSLFSGAGMLDRAVEEVFGARTAWVSEIDRGACKVLAHRYPGVPNLGDITTIDWSTVEPVDIIAGGSPCQDLSSAGRRAGMTDGTRSNLWVQMREAIAHVQPTYVVWENVRGALSAHAASDLEHCPGCMGDPQHGGPALRALGRVLGDLADLGFDAEVHGLRAADVGACHGRFRVFLLAWRREASADAHLAGLQGLADQAGAAPAERHGHPVAGAGRPDLTLLPTPTSNIGQNGGPQHPAKRRAGGHSVSIEDAIHGLALLPTPKAHDGDFGLPRTSNRPPEKSTHLATRLHYTDFSQYAPAIARHEQALGRPAPDPTEPGPKGNPRLSPAFVEFMMMLPAGWVTDVPGVTRTEALRMLGSGVVPQQAMAALLIMLDRAESLGVTA